MFPRQSTGHRNGKDTHTMSKDNVIAIKKPDTFVDDPISEILRQGARSLITQALEIEIEIFINQYKDLRDQMGSSKDRSQWVFTRTSNSKLESGLFPLKRRE
jgi:hypothetical protein